MRMNKYLSSFIVAILSFSLTFSCVGCTGAQEQQAVNLVVAELPTAIQLAESILSVTSAVGATNGSDSSTIASINQEGKLVASGLTDLSSLLAAYNANPSAAALAKVTAAVDTLVNNGDAALLAVSGIKDAKTQSEVQAGLAALDTVLHLIDGYLLVTQSPTQVKATAASRAVKLAAVKNQLNKTMIDQKLAPFGYNFNSMVAYETSRGL